MAKATKPAEANIPVQAAKLEEGTKATKPAEAARKFVVISPFQDAAEYAVDGVISRYNIGDDVSHFAPERLERLLQTSNVKAEA